jgi:predicted DNA-binding ribbon-helix-helix protein
MTHPPVLGVSINLGSRRTTVRLEPAFDAALDRIAAAEGVSRSECARRAVAAHPELGASAAIRVWVLERVLAAAADAPGAGP